MIGGVATVVLAIIAPTIIEDAEAQQQLQRSMITGTISPTAKQIIDAVKAECAKTVSLGTEPVPLEIKAVLVEECLFLVYESATTVVLNGDLLIPSAGGNINNPFIWQAVDEFKVQGYRVDSVMVSGEGSRGNPHQLYVVMSK